MSSPETLQKHLKRLLPPTPVGKSLPRRMSLGNTCNNKPNLSTASLAEAGAKLSGSNGKTSFSIATTPGSSVEGEDSSVTVAVRVRPFNERWVACFASKISVWGGVL